MKKILSLILVIGMLLSLLPIQNVFAKDEYVFFDSFEAGIANWDFYSSGNRDNSKTVLGKASDGKMYLSINDDLSDNIVGVQSKKINIEAGKTYFVTADIYHEKGKTLQMQVNLVDGGGKVLSTKTVTTANSQKWETGSAVIEAFDSASAGIVIIFLGGKTEVGTDYVDNVKVIEAKVTESGAVEDAEKYGPKEGDVIYSESFEEGTGKFSYSDSKAKECYEVSSDMSSEGNSSLFFHDDMSDVQVGTTSGRITVNEMRKYRLTADIYALEDRTQIQFRLYDADRVEIYRRNQYTEVGTKRWVSYFLDINAYPGAAYVSVIFAGERDKKPQAYIDNIKITDIGSLGTVDPASSKLKTDLNYRLSIARPGDVIEIPDGTYEHIKLKAPASGTAEQPITIKAKNPGKTILKGLSGIEVTGSYIVIEGLIWENAITVPDIISFKSSSSYCHFKDCAVIDCYSEDYATEQRWVGLSGSHHKVTGCYLRGKGNKGLMLELGIDPKVSEPGNYLVENCYFGDFKYGGVNGLEVIRTGLSDRYYIEGNSIVRNCFFEKCCSEVEIISTKCSGNQFYNNTLYNCNGAMWARHGDNNSFTGNLFIGAAKAERTTGVEIYGENHVVKDNYFYNLAISSPTIVLKDGNGSPNWVGFAAPVKNADVSNNTIIGSDIGIQMGDYTPNKVEKQNADVPPEGKIANNAVITYKGTGALLLKGTPVLTGIEFENNFVEGKEIGYEDGIPEGVTYGAIDYKIEDGYVIPTNGTGANIEEIKKTPKNPFDVICDWMKKEFYDTGKYTFEIVEGDPFNSDFDVNTLLPKKDGKLKVVINGYQKEFDVEPQLINSRTMVPMRAIFEEFDADVSWDEATASATATTEFTTVKITENSDTAYVNSTEIKLDSPAVIVDGRFLVPLRFISESFGATVDWLEDITTARITYVAPIGNVYEQEFKPQAPIENALTVYKAIQTGNDGTDRTIANIFNGGFTDKWPFREQADGTPGYGIFDLGSVKTIDKLMIGFGSGTERIYKFSIYVSDDGVNYTLVKENLSNSGVTTGLETFEMGGVKGRYVKYVGYGSNVNTWNNLIELFIIGK